MGLLLIEGMRHTTLADLLRAKEDVDLLGIDGDSALANR
jgi:hypothetical protein